MRYSAKRNVVVKGLIFCVALGACSMTALHAQVPVPKVVLPPTVEGDWVRTDEKGVGTWAGFDLAFGKATLTPEGEKLSASLTPLTNSFADISQKVGAVYVVRPHPCVFSGASGGGFGSLEFNSVGFHAIRSRNEIALIGENPGNARHIYLDGRPLPAPGTRTPTATGYSVGQIEPDGTLVVKTTNLTPAKVTGGGVRTATTIATQRFEPSPDGKRLRIVYIWDDPKLYAKPHTYQMTFERLPADAIAFEDFCDATDPLFSQSIVPPAQN
jgi:hypothetical protein